MSLGFACGKTIRQLCLFVQYKRHHHICCVLLLLSRNKQKMFDMERKTKFPSQEANLPMYCQSFVTRTVVRAKLMGPTSPQALFNFHCPVSCDHVSIRPLCHLRLRSFFGSNGSPAYSLFIPRDMSKIAQPS